MHQTAELLDMQLNCKLACAAVSALGKVHKDSGTSGPLTVQQCCAPFSAGAFYDQGNPLPAERT